LLAGSDAQRLPVSTDAVDSIARAVDASVTTLVVHARGLAQSLGISYSQDP
jgi:hypothetical protein